MAKVFIVEETPPKQFSSERQTLPKTMGTTASTQENVSKIPQEVSEQASLELVTQKQANGKALLYYPEESHTVNEQACSDFNAQIMKHILKQKMGKNDTFYNSKCVKGENHFQQVQRSQTPMSANRGMPLRKSQNLIFGSKTPDMKGAKRNNALVKSASDINFRGIMSAGSNSGLNNSKIV